ncbi:MAG TPA: hypothetical protein VJG32_07890 [Anaerolineae bacterium]|nr:hypothetical protein [Anaerolineae bacterium]
MPNATDTPINVEFPQVTDLHLKLTVGACHLSVKPGDHSAWVNGLYHDPAGALPLKIEQEGGTVKITQEYRSAEWLGLIGREAPRLDLTLGKTRPYVLTLEVGASESHFDLGGLPVTRLLVKQGAGKADFDFSALNPQPMSLLDLDAGAVGLEMRNLANANFAEMTIDGGAAAYKFDFSGTLQRDAHVRLTTGMSAVEVRVPAATAAKITTETVLGGLNLGDGFTRREGAFWTQAALAGQTPVLTMQASVSLGGLTLRTA